MASKSKIGRRLRARLLPAPDKSLGVATSGLLQVMRRTNRRAASNFLAAILRTVGPWLPEHRIGRENLIAAFPEKSPVEIEAILRGVWDNLGRITAEFAQVDRICEGDPENRPYISYTPGTAARFKRMRDDGKPALIFAAHLANWELPAIVAAADGLDTLVLYRRPNLQAVADVIIDIRKDHMGELVPTSVLAPMRLLRALESNRHVAILVDQHYVRGVEVTFFGRRCTANPLVAVLARETNAPIHGTRVIRMPDGRFQADLTEPVEPVRDAEGKIEVQGTMQAITNVVERWVREYPEQWLWLHRRWR
ncbi:MAG: lipid A biosynthesis lauroyl acyltransferase [Xanthobacteraceae bacterium]